MANATITFHSLHAEISVEAITDLVVTVQGSPEVLMEAGDLLRVVYRKTKNQANRDSENSARRTTGDGRLTQNA